MERFRHDGSSQFVVRTLGVLSQPDWRARLLASRVAELAGARARVCHLGVLIAGLVAGVACHVALFAVTASLLY